ncbi:MAG: hypothetical protein CMQ41_13175 [Gammaproteobacteria bacterium]|nr:hypothetical protein [Gammaproteobacteria bacterium]
MRYWFRLSPASALYLILLSGHLCPFVIFAAETEAYREIPMPPGFQVVVSELEGPVFADVNGKTLYKWPLKSLRNGYSGETLGIPACYDKVLKVTAGLMSPYPAGIKLPELDKRHSCVELWPPVYADVDAEPIGRWSILERNDGSLQWAFEEQPLYTSVRDAQVGDVLGGTTRDSRGDSPAYRVPIVPPKALPPGFAVKSTSIGRMLTTDTNQSVYSYKDDSASAVVCFGDCMNNWDPVLAPSLARGQGEWSLVERTPGEQQWVFRGKPLYTYALDAGSWSQEGSDVPGWSNVFTQKAPDVPVNFTVQLTIAGDVLANASGRTIYRYFCGEDSQDQLNCDHPADTQVYRLAVCGGGKQEKCLEHWPYVIAGESEESLNRTWRIRTIDPGTGRYVGAEQSGALRVWTYRDRPVYLYGLDKKPGDVNGGGTGEWRGKRNGLRAFWLRDDFMGGIL